MARKTKEQEMRVLRFIYDCIKSNDCAPTRKEIAEALGISSTTAYNNRICYLLGHDCLRKTETGKYDRRIALTEKGVSLCESFNDNRRTPTDS